MSDADKLKDYREKRDFQQTSEPLGEERIEKADGPRFVIQKHDASSMHYDFRLEVDGVLKSWAVPKGPSTDPREKRLAVQTEDHPLTYGDFEGVIPEDNYGAGTVMVWDRGRYRNIRAGKDDDGASMQESLDDGKVEVWLEGEKLRGGYVLIHTRMGGDENWLLKKIDDEEADSRRNPVSTEPDSVISGDSIKDIRERAEQ